VIESPTGYTEMTIWCVNFVAHSHALAHRDRIGRVQLGGRDTLFYIGWFSSPDAAQAAIESAKAQPGFIDEPDCFMVLEYPMNVDLWPQGFEPKWRRD
jgi:hypothetical protein